MLFTARSCKLFMCWGGTSSSESPDMKRMGQRSSGIASSEFHLIRKTRDLKIRMKNGMILSTIALMDRKVFSRTTPWTLLGWRLARETHTAPPRLLPNNIIGLFFNLGWFKANSNTAPASILRPSSLGTPVLEPNTYNECRRHVDEVLTVSSVVYH